MNTSVLRVLLAALLMLSEAQRGGQAQEETAPDQTQARQRFDFSKDITYEEWQSTCKEDWRASLWLHAYAEWHRDIRHKHDPSRQRYLVHRCTPTVRCHGIGEI